MTMKSSKIWLKLYAEPGALPDPIRFVEVFHDWIKRDVLAELMFDVIEYGHVHHGPSVLFVGHESDYAIDLGEGRLGLSYQRKRAPADGALGDSLRRLLDVAGKLEADPRLHGFRLGRSELLLRVLDRLNMPNGEGTFAEARGEIERTAREVLGAELSLEQELADLREPFGVRVRAA